MVFLNTMGSKTTLFDDSKGSEPTKKKEAIPLDRLKDLDNKITGAIKKVKALKAEKAELEKKLQAMELALGEKDAEIQRLTSEKSDIKGQIEGLLDELESIEED